MTVATAHPVAEFSGFGLRFVFALGLGALALAAVHFGHPWFTLMVGVGVALMAREWPELCLAGAGARPLWRPRPPAAAVAFVAAVLAAFVLAAAAAYVWAALAAAAGAALAFVLSSARPGIDRLLFALGVPYIAVPAAALLYLARDPDFGALTVYWLFAVVWATDIGGYVVGRAVGGPRLAPRISPGKTWAGGVGGTIAAALAATAFAPLAGFGEPVRLAVAGIVVSLVAQAGDLAESAAKRHFDVKDSGSIIPGHGGLFDRVDGLIAAATLAAGVAAATGSMDFLWR